MRVALFDRYFFPPSCQTKLIAMFDICQFVIVPVHMLDNLFIKLDRCVSSFLLLHVSVVARASAKCM